MTMSNRCPRCSAERPAHAAFCSKCGTRIPPQKTEGARASDPDDRGRGGAQTPTPQAAVSPPINTKQKTAQLIIFGLLLLFSVWLFVRRLSHGAPAFTTSIYHSKYGAVVYLLDLFPILYVPIIGLFLWAFVAAALNKLSPDREQSPSQGPVSGALGKQPRGTPDLPTPAAGGRSKLPLWAIALLVVPLLLVVLGLSLDAYNTFGGSNGAARPLATRLRSFQQGDSWDYRVSGNVTLADGRNVAIQDGSLHSEITALDAGGDFKKLTEEDRVNMTASNDGRTLPFSHTVRQTLSQDWGKATTFLMSDNGGPQDRTRTVRQPQVETPGTLSDGLSQVSHLDFDDGEHRDETTTVRGSEVVDTALGKMTVWRCVQEQTDSDGSHGTTTLWFAPQLGMPVRTSETNTLADGMVMTVTTDLLKTTVPL